MEGYLICKSSKVIAWTRFSCFETYVRFASVLSVYMLELNELNIHYTHPETKSRSLSRRPSIAVWDIRYLSHV